MGFFAKLLGRSSATDAALVQASALVPTVRALVTGAYAPLTEHFPSISHFSADDWDFFGSAGAIYLAVDSLQKEERSEQLNTILRRELDRWDKQGAAALADCSVFVGNALRGVESAKFEQTRSDAVGMWVLWNLYKRSPTHEEAAPARAIGTLLSESVRGWWRR